MRQQDGVQASVVRGSLAALPEVAEAVIVPVDRPVTPVGVGALQDPGADEGLSANRNAAASREILATPTVEELLEDGLYLAGASPVHLAIRGTPGAATVRCAWRGIARTAAQREDAIRFWLQLDATDAIPAPDYLESLFAATLDVLDPEYRETAKANFLAIARGGLSEEYLFLTCFADNTVTSYLLGAGPTTVTVAYDNRGEARSYELYRREHEAGTFGSDPLQAHGDYEASLQAIVVDAEKTLAAEIGGKERIVFLAPMGAHNAIAFEAWQAVAHWDVATADDDTVNAVRVGATAGARSAVTAAWTYGNGCVDLAVARNELYWTYVYADGTQRSVSLQASGDSPATWRVHLTHRDSGSPLTRVTWTYLRLTLGSERVAFTFTDPPSVTFNQAPTFAKASYAFTIAENAAVAAAVGRVAATDPDAGDALTYAITAGNTGGAFAIDASSGALMVAAALDHETTASYTLTVQASDGNGKSATATVTVTVTDVAE